MLYYILMAGAPDVVEGKNRDLRAALSRAVFVAGGRWHNQMSTNRKWAFSAVSVPDPILRQRLAVSNRGAFFINGPVIRLRGSTGSIAETALTILADGSPDQLFDAMEGSYNCASITLRNGLVAFGDFSGTYPVYVKEGDGYVAASNRAGALHALDDNGYDLSSLGWLVGHTNIFGTATPFRGVDLVRPGTHAVAAPIGGRLAFRPMARSVWPERSATGDRDDLSPAEWDDATETLIGNVRAAAGVADRIRMSLTGGKDSRLTLALAKAAGVADKLETFTNGPSTSPEVECAAAVAKAAGVRHIAGGSKPTPQKDFDPGPFWRRLRMHVKRYESLVCPWDGCTGAITGTTLEITGFGGELYRGGHAKQFKGVDFDDTAKIAAMWTNYHHPMDPLQALTPAAARYQKAWLQDWLATRSQHCRLDVLPERFYVENRLAHWNGPLAQGVPGVIKLMPLLSADVARAVFQLSRRARDQELLHFEVMSRAAPDLAAMPFLGDAWSPTLMDRARLAPEPFKPSTELTHKALSPWQWMFVGSQAREISNLIREAAAKTALTEIIDMPRILNRIAAGPRLTRIIDVKAILSGVSIAMTLLGRGEAFEDKPTA